MRTFSTLVTTVLFIFHFAVISCQQKSSMKRFNYETGNSCPTYYDIETYRQVMYAENDELIMIDGVGPLRSPWGDGGVTYVKSSESGYPVPKILKVGYYSETEDLFYEGEFVLPSAEIRNLLEESSEDPFYRKEKNIPSKYNRIELGIALGGLVVMWVKGPGEQKEVAKFKTKKVDYEWNDIFERGTREAAVKYNLKNIFTEKVRNEVLNKTLPIDLWERYREKFSWNYTINIPDGAVVSSVYMKMINAEAETNYTSNPSNQPAKRAVPYHAEINWQLHGKKYQSRVVFAEDPNYYDIIYLGDTADAENSFPEDLTAEEAYQKFKKLNSAIPAHLVFNISTVRDLNVVLKQGNENYPIQKIIGKTFEQ